MAFFVLYTANSADQQSVLRSVTVAMRQRAVAKEQ
jgi:hypothetical protein